MSGAARQRARRASMERSTQGEALRVPTSVRGPGVSETEREEPSDDPGDEQQEMDIEITPITSPPIVALPPPTSTHVYRPPRPPAYDCEEKGELKLHQWIPAMKNYFRSYGMPYEQRGPHAATNIVGKALTWHTNRTRHDESVLDDWNTFRTELEKRFQDKNRRKRMMDDFFNMKHEQGSLKDYNDRFTTVYGEIEDSITLETAVHRYISGLRPKTRLDVEREDPSTLEEAMAKAENVETIFRGTSYGGNRGGRGGFSTPTTHVAVHSSYERRGSPMPKIKEEELNKMEDKSYKIKCYKCGQLGHIRKNCMNQKKGTR